MKTLVAADFAELFAVDERRLPQQCLSAIAGSDLRYTELSGPERDACILKILKVLESGQLGVVGPANRERWERGWQENLDEYLTHGATPESLIPKYCQSNDIFRYRGALITPASIRFETAFYTVTRQIMFSRYLADADTVIDFGCGTGTSLIVLSDMFPEKRLIGCDWATSSQSLLKALAQKQGRNITGIHFDMFAPHDDVPFSPGCGVITMHSMEQLGKNFDHFLNYLLKHKPGVCAHFEPIEELYDEENLLDFLAKTYHQKRNYLSGFLTALRSLEAEGKVSILEVRRLYLGNLYKEGHCMVVWKPP